MLNTFSFNLLYPCYKQAFLKHIGKNCKPAFTKGHLWISIITSRGHIIGGGGGRRGDRGPYFSELTGDDLLRVPVHNVLRFQKVAEHYVYF